MDDLGVGAEYRRATRWCLSALSHNLYMGAAQVVVSTGDGAPALAIESIPREDGAMASSSLLQLVSVLGGAGAIGAITTYLVGRRAAKTSLLVAQVQSETQIVVANRQFEAQRMIEVDKWRREKLETSYEALTLWLHDMESMVNELWACICRPGSEMHETALKIMDGWPWETLRPPREASRMSYCWSSQVQSYVRELSGISGALISAARSADQYRDDLDKKMFLQNAKGEVWDRRSDLCGQWGRLSGRFE